MTDFASARPNPAQPAAAAHSELSRATVTVRTVNLIAVTLPFLGFVAAATLLWGRGVSAVHLAVFAGMYVLTGIGITVGYHRLFTHRSFEAVRPVKWALAILGSMAVEGPLLRWVANHRVHHQHSDTEADLHSPHHAGEHGAGALAGLWHAHIGWLFNADRGGLARYVGDLKKDPDLQLASRLFPVWVVLGLLIPAVLSGLVTLSWTDALLGFVWGGLARIFLVHHTTWSINSVCHLWGSRPFDSHDESRNNAVFGLLAMGEGWHNNHHAFPTSARHGLRWWEFDGSYVLIRALAFCGLASNVKVPNPQAVAAKRK